MEKEDAETVDSLSDWQKVEMEDATLEAERTIKKLRRDADRVLREQIEKVERTRDMKLRVIPKLRSKPESIFGSMSIFIHSDDYHLAHDVAATLGVRLDKTAESDGINYHGELDGVTVTVYGMQKTATCQLIKKTVMKAVDVYELKCEDIGKEKEEE